MLRLVIMTICILLLFATLAFWRAGKRDSLRPALFRAIRNKNYADVKLALDRGADPNAKIVYQGYGLTWRDMLLLYIGQGRGNGTSVDGCCGETALIEAIETNDGRIVRLLLERGANPKLVGFHGFGPTDVARDYHEVPRNPAILILLEKAIAK